MQSTFEEWRTSGAAAQGVTCASCHLPAGDHTLPGPRTPGRLRAALALSVHTEGSAIIARITSRGVGHALPTGDPYRRLWVSIWAPGPLGRPYLLTSRALARRVESTRMGWRLVEDNRIPAPTEGEVSKVRVRLPLDAPLPEGAFARLSYALADPLHRGMIRSDRTELTIEEIPLRP